VVRHKPKDFLIVFEHPHHRDAALALGRLLAGNLAIRIKPWRILPYGDHRDFRHHVRICLEGIPVHAWNESIAKRAWQGPATSTMWTPVRCAAMTPELCVCGHGHTIRPTFLR
jgi:hypothetical protein